MGEAQSSPILQAAKGADEEVLQAVSEAFARSRKGDVLLTPDFLLSKLPDIT